MLETIEHIRIGDPGLNLIGFVCFWNDGRAWFYDYRPGATKEPASKMTHDEAIDLTAGFVREGFPAISLKSQERV